jgi:hypothetical protein
MTRNAVIARQFEERRVETCVLDGAVESEDGVLASAELTFTDSEPSARMRLASTFSFVLPL